MISIIMAVKDNLYWTRKTVESVLHNTQEPFELIVIDNGSAAETCDYLQMSVHGQGPCVVLRNESNLGCAAAWNQGLRYAQGTYACLINNDIEVPIAWLGKLKNRFLQLRQETSLGWLSPAMREGEHNEDLQAFNLRLQTRLKGRIFLG